MIEFTHIVDFIFKNKDKYSILSAEDKENNFFIVNRKFARKFPRHAQLLNHKSVDKACAMDIWYNYFTKTATQGIPGWYWFKQNQVKKIKIPFTSEEINFFCNYYDITLKDIEFLFKYYPEDLENEVKIFRKFNKNK